MTLTPVEGRVLVVEEVDVVVVEEVDVDGVLVGGVDAVVQRNALKRLSRNGRKRDGRMGLSRSSAAHAAAFDPEAAGRVAFADVEPRATLADTAESKRSAVPKATLLRTETDSLRRLPASACTCRFGGRSSLFSPLSPSLDRRPNSAATAVMSLRVSDQSVRRCATYHPPDARGAAVLGPR